MSVDQPRGSTDNTVDLKDLLEVQVEPSEQLMVESRRMMTSSIQLRCSSQRVAGILKDKGSNLVGPNAYLLLKWNTSRHLITSFRIAWLRASIDYDEHDGKTSNRIALHVAYTD